MICPTGLPNNMSNTKPAGSVILRVKGLGHVPSFKNKKRAILDRSTGKMRTLTAPEASRWMRKCEDAFVSQLFSWYQIAEGAMPTALSRRSWIACAVPLDDSVNHIREIHVSVLNVDKGEEGAMLAIECYSTEVLGNATNKAKD